jgi:hypothetical protein
MCSSARHAVAGLQHHAAVIQQHAAKDRQHAAALDAVGLQRDDQRAVQLQPQRCSLPQLWRDGGRRCEARQLHACHRHHCSDQQGVLEEAVRVLALHELLGDALPQPASAPGRRLRVSGLLADPCSQNAQQRRLACAVQSWQKPPHTAQHMDRPALHARACGAGKMAAQSTNTKPCTADHAWGARIAMHYNHAQLDAHLLKDKGMLPGRCQPAP